MSRLKHYRYRSSRVATVDLDADRLVAVEPPLAQADVPRRLRALARQLPPLPGRYAPTGEQLARGARITDAFARLAAGGDANTTEEDPDDA